MTGETWKGVFATYQEATASCEQSNTVFELDTWLWRQRALADRAAELLRQGCQGPRPTLLPALVAGEPLAVIVDLGGGSGWVREQLRGLGLVPHRYIVRDLAKVVDFYREHPVSGVEYQYLNDTSLDAVAPIDLLYANSSLQYMPDNAGLINQVRRLRPRTLLIDELLWAPGDQDWFTVQVNSDIASVARFVSLRRLVGELHDEGMKLVWSGAFGGGHVGYTFPDMDGFPPKMKNEAAKSLVFRSRGA